MRGRRVACYFSETAIEYVMDRICPSNKLQCLRLDFISVYVHDMTCIFKVRWIGRLLVSFLDDTSVFTFFGVVSSTNKR